VGGCVLWRRLNWKESEENRKQQKAEKIEKTKAVELKWSREESVKHFARGHRQHLLFESAAIWSWNLIFKLLNYLFWIIFWCILNSAKSSVTLKQWANIVIVDRKSRTDTSPSPWTTLSSWNRVKNPEKKSYLIKLYGHSNWLTIQIKNNRLKTYVLLFLKPSL
jgi:hypothetical protein